MNDPAPRAILWRWLDQHLGTETYLCHPRRGFHLSCITCGSPIPWRALFTQWWHYTTYMVSPAAKQGEPAFESTGEELTIPWNEGG